MRTGRLAHDPDRLAAVPPHVYAAEAVPASLDRTAIPFRPLMLDNDRYGICTFASATNSRRGQSWVRNGTDWTTAQPSVVASFAACAGILNTDAALAACQGLRMLDVIDWAQTRGIDMGNQTIEVPTVRSVAPTDRNGMAHAIDVAGSWLGVDLTQEDINALAAGDPLLGPPAGPFLEGHAIDLWDYKGLRDTDTLRIATYAGFYTADWTWIATRTQEAYCLTWA
jgi:hypothetical protein